ncbi:MAG: hypothetical protein ACK5LX_11550 [Oscillospiraceae bacterium]
MNYKKAYIKLYGAAGAALEELDAAIGADVNTVRAKAILTEGINQSEEIVLSDEETKIRILPAG